MPGTTPIPIDFSGGAGVTKIVCSLGAADIATGYTMLALVYPRSVAAYNGILQVVTSTPTDCVSFEVSAAGTVVGSVDAVEITYAGIASITANDWYILGITKPSGSATARGHRYKFSTGVWSHADHVGAIADTARTQSTIQIGEWVNTDNANMIGAVWAIWNSNLSDAQLETLNTNLDAWEALAPDWWVIGNGSTAMIDETGGSGNETSREAGVTSGVARTSPLDWIPASRLDTSQFPKTKLRPTVPT